MISAKTFLVLVSGCLIALAVACDRPAPLSQDTARAIRTPVGNELNVSCPPSLEDLVGPTKIAQIMGSLPTQIPSWAELGISPDDLIPPGSLCALLPGVPDSSEPIVFCPLYDNTGAGGMVPVVDEDLLDQMGRVCGTYLTVDGPLHAKMDIRVDVYVSSAGSEEAYRRAESAMRSLKEPSDRMKKCVEGVTGEFQALIDAQAGRIGDERDWRIASSWEGPLESGHCSGSHYYTLVFRRHNLYVELSLNYVRPAPLGIDHSPQPLLDYATQLDTNIEAAASEQATPMPQ
jgi:hypothetical protein